jgi:hypothetical protein
MTRTEIDTLLCSIVRAVIRQTGTEHRFGPDKVYICSVVYGVMMHPMRPANLTPEIFRRWLLVANRACMLTLARGDLIGAMDPGKVAASELVCDGAEFHFILDQ